MSDISLKPCPFCRCTPGIKIYPASHERNYEEFKIICVMDFCRNQTPKHYDLEIIAEQWNRRVGDE